MCGRAELKTDRPLSSVGDTGLQPGAATSVWARLPCLECRGRVPAARHTPREGFQHARRRETLSLTELQTEDFPKVQVWKQTVAGGEVPVTYA